MWKVKGEVSHSYSKTWQVSMRCWAYTGPPLILLRLSGIHSEISGVQSVTKVSQMVTGRLARRPIQFERHWPGDPTTGQRGGAPRSGRPVRSDSPFCLDGPSPIPQPGALKLSSSQPRWICDTFVTDCTRHEPGHQHALTS